MKSIKIKLSIAILAILGLFLTSCEDYLDINQDPNQSTTSDINLQLSSGQLQIAIGVGQRIFPNLGIWCQYHAGGPGVSLGEPDQHQLSSSESNDIFTRTYRGSTNLNYIIKNAPDQKNYVAIAKLMKAYGVQNCVDLFGDVPYAEAFRGDIADGSILHPKYDKAEDVYNSLINEVNDAIQLIHDGNGLATPKANDIVYGGDMHAWEAFAHTLLLKLYIRSGKNTEAITAAGDGTGLITTNAVNGKVAFPGGSTASNPFWTAGRSTALGNYYVATTTSINYLLSTNDPRIDVLYDKPAAGGGHNGMKPGDVENAPANSSTFSTPAGATKETGGFLYNATMPVLLITSWEGNLLLAEAAVLAGKDPKPFYDAAVKAHFEYCGIAAASAAYLTGSGALDAAKPMKSIALQKWVCMNGLQPVEGWIETRRYDNDNNALFQSRNGGIFIEPTKNSLGAGIFPSIYPYPENEESLNQKFPGQHSITAKVFWDK